MSQSAAPWGLLKIEKDLATEFLGVFSRFEYALKMVAKFREYDEKKKNLKPNWMAFAKATAIDVENEERSAFDYLLNQPPLKQVLVGDDLEWADARCTDTKIASVVIYICRVRNNLFHGGKFSKFESETQQIDAARDQKLVECSLKLLVALSHDSTIEAFFYY